MFNLFKKKVNCELISNFQKINFQKNILSTSKDDFFFEDYKSEFLDFENLSLDVSIFSIYRNILKNYDKLLFESSKINCDLFIVNSGFVGREYFKTCSMFIENVNLVSVPILFEVLNGEGYFLIQDKNNSSNLKLIKVNKGSKVLIPINFIYTIINSSETEKLVCLSLKDSLFDYKFKVLEKKFGGVLYFTKNNGFIRNQNYLPSYHLEEFEGSYLGDYSFNLDKSIYKEFIDIPEKFNFLKNNSI